MSAVQTAIGLAHAFHKDAPVAFFDTEKGSDFALPIFSSEGIKLLRVKSRAFADLLSAVSEAESNGCCALIVDSMTHVWAELMESFCRKRKISRIQFEHWREIKGTWRDWTDLMLNSRLHMLICGRAGKEYEYQENDETGKKELISLGAKFKAEGEFGYEPDVLIELWTEREEGSKRGSRLVHKGLVLKDRAWSLNGKEFSWKDKSAYKKADYQSVYKCFEPYFNVLSIGGVHHAIDAERTSDGMFGSDTRDSSRYRQQQLKKAALEDWDSTLDLCFPGSSTAMKRARAIVGESITGVRSRTKFEQFDLKRTEECVSVLLAFERRLKAEPVEKDEDLTAMVEMAKEDFRMGAEQQLTLLEARLTESVKQAVEANNKADEEQVPF